jgi:hypothetical protein
MSKKEELPLIPPHSSFEFQEGVKAYTTGKRLIENPYRYKETDRPKYVQWFRGYLYAEQVMRLRNM